MQPLTQFGQDDSEHLGFGLYRDEWDETYNWFGFGWSDESIEWVTWGSCIAILALTGLIVFRRLRGRAFLPWLALPIAVATFAIGIMHSMADDGDGDISALRSAYTMPAFTLYCCWLPLRSRARRGLWWLLDLLVLVVAALSFYAQNIMFDLSAPLWFFPWFMIWLVVRIAIRDGRLASAAAGRAWRFMILAHAVALSIPAIGLLTNTVFYEEFVYVIALLALPALSLGMCVFLLALFQLKSERVKFG